ncbi:MAG: hypothetical protein Q8M02_06910 [Candidatus Didemnitutus sp.]|nr:hypothetical protein [Candidatus Didemnitutus sp.]
MNFILPRVIYGNLGDLASRLLDQKRQTVDVTPPPHIAPCGMTIPGARLAAATAKPHRPKKSTNVDQLLRDAGVKLPESKGGAKPTDSAARGES